MGEEQGWGSTHAEIAEAGQGCVGMPALGRWDAAARRHGLLPEAFTVPASNWSYQFLVPVSAALESKNYLQFTFMACAFRTFPVNIRVYSHLDALHLVPLESASPICSKVVTVSLPDEGDVLAPAFFCPP